ncbi:MAG: hypothetical protein U9N55_00415, partial [candidate division Zixibacteria bacterium]|nr:hypothetical protein [candidate division Zixibacteria bacterium]
MKIVSEHTHTRNITSAYDKIAEQIRDTLSLPQLRHQSRAVRLTVNVKDVEPLQWLQAQTELPRLFWSDRMSHHQTAAVGVANRLRESLIDSENLLNPEYPELRYYGGICFDAQESQRGIWSEFGASSFVIPRFELVKNQ